MAPTTEDIDTLVPHFIPLVLCDMEYIHESTDDLVWCRSRIEEDGLSNAIWNVWSTENTSSRVTLSRVGVVEHIKDNIHCRP